MGEVANYFYQLGEKGRRTGESEQERKSRARSIAIGRHICNVWPTLPPAVKQELKIARYKSDAEWRECLRRNWDAIFPPGWHE